MYTQCPECSVAFRVTADVLKQAAGQVRCGGCGIAFNALAHLSEQKLAAPVQPGPISESQVPELKPDEPGELEADTPPQSISAAQSAALLKTLDQLAGSNIRIEDTGVEWRVIDDDEVDDGPPPDEPIDIVAEMRFDDNTPLPDNFDFGVETSPPPPELERDIDAAEAAAKPQEAQADLAFGDPDEWEDLLGDLAEPVEESSGEDLVALAEAQAESEPDEPLDMDTQFAIQAEAMGIDLSGLHEAAEEEAEEIIEDDEGPADDTDDERESSIDHDLIAAAFETEAAEQAAEEFEEEAEADESDEELDEAQGEEIENELDNVIQAEDDVEFEADVEDIVAEFDDEVENVIETIASELDSEDDDQSEDEPEEKPNTRDESDEHEIPEMTEEEKTINMMIDQELFNIAVEDEDGFASTLVQLQPNNKVGEELDESQEPAEKDESLSVETIVMEGEFVRSQLDSDTPSTEKTAESRRFDDPGISIPFKETIRAAFQGSHHNIEPPGAGTIAGVVALVLLLVLQVVHQSREGLATVPAFNKAVGPVYRMLGKPITPSWDISGWRFEATKGSTEMVGNGEATDDINETVENNEVLTIYSRVGNKSDKALPYPLVRLSLTDRFEDIIGSRVLEPGEYLAESADPRKLVPPGNTFNAVISIESPSEQATGFKLNVCYRLASGQLRCAIEDFK